MTDLQAGLLAIGAAAVAGVFLYNRLQERSAARRAERTFSSRHADALLEEGATRREPVPDSAARDSKARDHDAVPDERIDYVIDLRLARAAAASTVLEHWAPIGRRFGKRSLLAAAESGGSHRLLAGESASCAALRAGLQLVSRAGVTGEAEVLEFRSEVESLAAKLKAAISAPQMCEALDAARELDAACAEADIQVALHVVDASIDDESIARLGAQPFQITRRGSHLTLTLDVAHTKDIGRSYEAMARAAWELASVPGARLVDDRGRVLDEDALIAIGAQLEPVRESFARFGIEPGGPLALRLFS